MKTIILIFLTSTIIYSQYGEFGARVQLGFNGYGIGYGGGLHFRYSISEISSLRLLVESNNLDTGDYLRENYPLVALVGYGSYQIKLQYLYYFPNSSDGPELYLGAGLGKFFYHSEESHNGDLDGLYTRAQYIEDAIGFDVILGVRVSDLFSAEVNYIINHPEVSSEVMRQSGDYDFYTVTRKVNMSTFYLNLIFSINTSSL